MTSWSWSGSWVGSKPANFGPPASLLAGTDPKSITSTAVTTTVNNGATPTLPSAATSLSVATSTSSSTSTSTSTPTTTPTTSKPVNIVIIKTAAGSPEPTQSATLPGPYDAATTSSSANSLSGDESSKPVPINKTAGIVGGTLGVLLVTALVIGLLVYRHRKRRNRSLDNTGFEQGMSGGASGDYSSSSSSHFPAGAGFAAGVVAAGAVRGKSQDPHGDSHVDRQPNFSNGPAYGAGHSTGHDADHGTEMVDMGGMAAAAAMTGAARTHQGPPRYEPSSHLQPPMPSHTRATSAHHSVTPPGSNPTAAAVTTAAMTAAAAAASNHHSNRQQQQQHSYSPQADSSGPISSPVWTPHRYDTSLPVGEYNHRKSITSDYHGSDVSVELSNIPDIRSPRDASKLNTTTDSLSPTRASSSVEASSRNLTTFSFHLEDSTEAADTSMTTAVMAAGQPESNGNVSSTQGASTGQQQQRAVDPNHQSRLSSLSDIVSLRPGDLADGDNHGQPNHPIYPPHFLAPVAEEDEEDKKLSTEGDVSNRSGTLSKLMESGFNPELMFGIPNNPNSRRPHETGGESRPASDYDDRRASMSTFATRSQEQRAPSFVDRDSAFFPNDQY